MVGQNQPTTTNKWTEDVLEFILEIVSYVYVSLVGILALVTCGHVWVFVRFGNYVLVIGAIVFLI